MSDVNMLGVAFYIAAFLVSVTCIVYTFIQNRNDKLQRKMYIAMVAIIGFNTVTEAIISLATPYLIKTSSLVDMISICKFSYFVTHTAMLAMLGYYVLSITGRISSLTRTKNIIFLLPVLGIETLMFTNPLHHWCYYYDPVTFEYHRGVGVTVLYVVSMFYILFFIVNLFNSWKAITKKRRLAMSYFLVMVVTGILLQLFFVNLRVELFAESLAFLGVLLTVEDEGDLIDNEVGIYNRRALEIDLDNLFINKKPFRAICIKVENADLIRRVTGSANESLLTNMMYVELIKYIPRYRIYQTSTDTFVMILVQESREQAMEMVNNISERFEKSWKCLHADILLSATVILAELPEDIDNTQDLLSMADSSLPIGHKKLLTKSEDFRFIMRRRDLEGALQRGLSEGGFEVWYQPTFTGDGLRIHGAEALVRLRDPRLGLVMPDEFIPLAEQIGLIGEIDDHVLTTVCNFIASGVPQSLGVGSINVNLSVLQCIKPGFVEHITDIVDRSGVSRESVNLEITESVDANDYSVMRSVISQFKDNGFRVYMDDYGTGYSNMQALFSMDFDIIKIDKSILWATPESELGMNLLKNIVRMLQEMNFKIVAEGVETEEQVNLLQSLGADYLQGYYFSKPVPQEDFVKLLKNGRVEYFM